MARRTKKIGITGRFGARYGRKIKLRVKEIEEQYRTKKYECPNCKAIKVKRLSTAIWECLKCRVKFAGGAYIPFPAVEAIKAEGKIVSVEEFKKEHAQGAEPAAQGQE